MTEPEKKEAESKGLVSNYEKALQVHRKSADDVISLAAEKTAEEEAARNRDTLLKAVDIEKKLIGQLNSAEKNTEKRYKDSEVVDEFHNEEQQKQINKSKKDLDEFNQAAEKAIKDNDWKPLEKQVKKHSGGGGDKG